MLDYKSDCIVSHNGRPKTRRSLFVMKQYFIKPDLSLRVASFPRFSLYCLNYKYSSSHIHVGLGHSERYLF